MKVFTSFIVTISSSIILSQNQSSITEVPDAPLFSPSSVRGELNLSSIPDFVMPPGKILAWDMSNENTARSHATPTGDVNHIFKKGFTHLEKKSMINGLHFYEPASNRPNGWTSPIAYRNRALMFSSTDIFAPNLNSQYYYSNITGGYKGADIFGDPRIDQYNDSDPFNLHMADWECCLEVNLSNSDYQNELNRKLAFQWSRKQNNHPSNSQKWLAAYDFSTMWFYRFDPSAPGGGPYVSPNNYRNPYFTATASYCPQDVNGQSTFWDATVNPNTNAQLPDLLYGQSFATINNLHTLEIYPHENQSYEYTSGTTYNIKSVYDGSISPYTVEHDLHYYQDNWLFKIVAFTQATLKSNTDKPLVPVFALWSFPWMAITGVGIYDFPTSWSNYTDYDVSNCHHLEINKAQAEATAIFPYMLGVKGSYLWNWQGVTTAGSTWSGTLGSIGNGPNDYFIDNNVPANRLRYSPVEHFSHSMYRLFGLNSDIFDGTEQYLSDLTEVSFDNGQTWISGNAPVFFEANKPFVTAVVNDCNILIAAQKMYAPQNYSQSVKVRYTQNGNNWSGDFEVSGDDVFLGRANMCNISNIDEIYDNNLRQKIHLSPNPASDMIYVNTTYEESTIKNYEFYNLVGEKVKTEIGNKLQLNTSDLINGIYYIKAILKDNSYINAGKIVISK